LALTVYFTCTAFSWPDTVRCANSDTGATSNASDTNKPIRLQKL